MTCNNMIIITDVNMTSTRALLQKVPVLLNSITEKKVLLIIINKNIDFGVFPSNKSPMIMSIAKCK